MGEALQKGMMCMLRILRKRRQMNPKKKEIHGKSESTTLRGEETMHGFRGKVYITCRAKTINKPSNIGL